MRCLASTVLALVVVACSSSPQPSANPRASAGGGGQGGGAANAAAGSGGLGAAGGGSAAGTGGTAGSAANAGVGGAGGSVPCAVDGSPGTCIDAAVCTAMAGYAATPGYCAGASNIQCCTPSPSVADNPPPPDGYKLMAQSDVTPDMTAWAIAILDDPTDYPMFSTATKTFGALTVLARVEWHPPDFQNDTVHRGVTLYEPI